MSTHDSDKSGYAAATGFIIKGGFKTSIDVVGLLLALSEAVPCSKEHSDEAKRTSETQEPT